LEEAVGIVWIGVFSVWVGRGGWLAGVRVDDTELDNGRRVNGTTVSANAAHAGLLWLLSDGEVVL
jgi:hypothetical protein